MPYSTLIHTSKYELNPEKTSHVLKQGMRGALGGVEYCIQGDIIFGGKDFEEVRIDLAAFWSTMTAEPYKLPEFLERFTAIDLAHLCATSNHCWKARDELLELIILSILRQPLIKRIR